VRNKAGALRQVTICRPLTHLKGKTGWMCGCGPAVKGWRLTTALY